MVLFGSRAAGTWTDGSDIDLAVIGGSKDAAEDALDRICDDEHNPYADCDRVPYAQIFHYAPAEFDELRRSRPHVAGQVQAHGLLPNGTRLPAVAQDNPWPGIKNSLLICQRYLSWALFSYRGDEHGGANRYEELYEHIHQAVKMGLGAGLAAGGADFEYDKNLLAMAGQLRDDRAAQLFELLPPASLQELSTFRTAIEYEFYPTRLPWPSIDVGDLLAAVQQACGRMAAEALAFTGKSPRDVGYEPCDKAHPDEWDANGSLGGWESLPLDYFADAQMRARARRAVRALEARANSENDRVGIMRGVCAHTAMTLAQIDEVERNWRRHGAPDDASERVVAVFDKRAAWRDLLVEPTADGPAETDRMAGGPVAEHGVPAR